MSWKKLEMVHLLNKVSDSKRFSALSCLVLAPQTLLPVVLVLPQVDKPGPDPPHTACQAAGTACQAAWRLPAGVPDPDQAS